MASEELDVQFSNASYSNDQDAIQPVCVVVVVVVVVVMSHHVALLWSVYY